MNRSLRVRWEEGWESEGRCCGSSGALGILRALGSLGERLVRMPV
jgi:hypothetical protein